MRGMNKYLERVDVMSHDLPGIPVSMRDKSSFQGNCFGFRVASFRSVFSDNMKPETKNPQLPSSAQQIRDCSRSVHE
jgi:hypothetical protein